MSQRKLGSHVHAWVAGLSNVFLSSWCSQNIGKTMDFKESEQRSFLCPPFFPVLSANQLVSSGTICTINFFPCFISVQPILPINLNNNKRGLYLFPQIHVLFHYENKT